MTGLLLVLLAAGCAQTLAPACTAADLAELQAVYADELLAACGDFKSLAECPSAPALREAHDARVRSWVECQP